jgi:hypothetical protein
MLEQLLAKRQSFHAFDDEFQREAQAYAGALERLSQFSPEELQARLFGQDAPGALPTAEFSRAPELCLSFGQTFAHHTAARAWACEQLLGHTTLAVDGSQILPDSTLSIPLAAVQVAWFINSHTQAGHYVKDLAFELLAPEALKLDWQGERQFSEQAVNFQRFEFEIETLCRLLRELAASAPQQLPVAFFDSSLVISFAEQLHDQMRAQYVEAVLQLLRCSEQAGVPLVGYVDASRARDLTRLLALCFNLPEAERVHDAQLLAGTLGWGARSPFFVCARGSARSNQKGVLESFAEYRRGVGFVYLKTNAAAPPARLEIPLWVYERGLLDEVIDLVRAEVIVGNGYPYALETADAAAVLSGRDREAFYALFQRFAEQEGIALRVNQKAASKARRR